MAKQQKTKKWRGRGLDESALNTVTALISDMPMRRDLLIEYLHRIQDSQHCLPAAQLNALAHLMKISPTEVYEVASFYHHFSSKDALFTACVTDGYAHAVEGISALVDTDEMTPEQKVKSAFDVLYDSIVLSPVGRLSPLIAEVSRTMPSVAKSFRDDYIAVQHDAFMKIVRDGVTAGSFSTQDEAILSHIVFGPIVTLSLSREMFAELGDLDGHFPVDKLKSGHLDMVLRELRV